MPRRTELLGYGFAVADTHIPEVDPKDGQVIHDALGRPKMLPAKQIVFFDQLGDHVIITLGDAARSDLVARLTGITIPNIEIAH